MRVTPDEIDIFSALPAFYADAPAVDVTTPIPTDEDPHLLAETLRGQARIFQLLEQHGQITDEETRALGAKVQAAVAELDALLNADLPA